MSFKMVAQAFDMRVGNPLRKMVLIKLADQANDDGYCWPSYDSLAHACEISKRSVIDHIKWLEEQSFLRVEKRYNKEKQKNESNRYYLTLDKAVQFVAKKPKSKSKKGGSAGAAPLKEGGSAGAAPLDIVGSDENTPLDVQGVVQELHQGSAGAAPKPINESINTTINNNSKNKIICDSDSDSKNEVAVISVTDEELLVEFWNSHRPAKAAVKPAVWAKSVKARLKTFTVDEIKQAMLYVLQSHWHAQNGQVAIKNAIDSDKRCADAIEKQSQKQPINSQQQNQGNHHDQSQQQQQPHQPATNSKQSKLDALRARAAAAAAEQSDDYQSAGMRTVGGDDDECDQYG